MATAEEETTGPNYFQKLCYFRQRAQVNALADYNYIDIPIILQLKICL